MCLHNLLLITGAVMFFFVKHAFPQGNVNCLQSCNQIGSCSLHCSHMCTRDFLRKRLRLRGLWNLKYFLKDFFKKYHRKIVTVLNINNQVAIYAHLHLWLACLVKKTVSQVLRGSSGEMRYIRYIYNDDIAYNGLPTMGSWVDGLPRD